MPVITSTMGVASKRLSLNEALIGKSLVPLKVVDSAKESLIATTYRTHSKPLSLPRNNNSAK